MCSYDAVTAFCISSADTNWLFAAVASPWNTRWCQPKKFFRSKDYGNSWQDLTDSVKVNSFPVFDSMRVVDMVSHPQDRRTIWLALSGFFAPGGENLKVVVSHNGGATFQNYSTGLPNVPINCLRYLRGSDSGLFAGTDAGMYYIDVNQTVWQPFNTGLPICPVTDIEINDPERKVRASTFGRGIWETRLDCDFDENNPLLIHQDVTWSHDTILNNSVYIDSACTLTITTRVQFPPMAKIYVKQGGKLIVDGGTLTKKCGNAWQGIEVWGREDKPQNTYYQGFVALVNGATIENARIAITTCKKDIHGEFEWTTSGGIIRAYDAVFRDNYKALEFILNKRGQYQSFFKRTLFETTINYPSNDWPEHLVSLLGVKGVQFLGCTFRNTANLSGHTPGTDAGFGIYSLGSTFIVDQDEYCPIPATPCPTPQFIPSRFEGLRYGIRALGTDPAGTVKINYTDFVNNYRGAYLSSVNYAEIVRNHFVMEPDPEGMDTIYGLFLKNSTGYKIEENHFKCTGNTIITDDEDPFLLREFGIVVDSSGSLPNEIYKNYFDSLDCAINAQRQNRHTADSTGLVVKCSNYFNNNYDKIITGLQTGGYDGIAAKQGAKTASSLDPAGNLFSPFHGGVNYLNFRRKLDIDNIVQPIMYFHHFQNFGDTIFRTKPTLKDDAKVINSNTYRPFDSISCCPSRIFSGGSSEFEDLLERYADETTGADSIQTLLHELIDGGSTESLNDEVVFSIPADAFTLQQELLSNSPYLTDTVMKSAIKKESVLPNEMIRDILVANPQASQSEEVMVQLDQRFNPMPEEMMEDIMANQDSLSPKDQLEAAVQAALISRQNAYNDLMRYYIMDTSATADPEEPVELLQDVASLEQRYRLAYAYYFLGLTDQMNAEIEQIPLTYDLDGLSQAQYTDFNSFFSILSGITDDNRTIFQLSATEASQLLSLCNQGLEPIRSWIQNIMESNRLNYDNEIVLIPNNLKSSNAEGHITRGHRKNSAKDVDLQVYPNPSHQFILVQYRINRSIGSEDHFRLSIISPELGRTTEYREVNGISQEILFDLRNYPVGAYLVSLSRNDRVIRTAKFIIYR